MIIVIKINYSVFIFYLTYYIKIKNKTEFFCFFLKLYFIVEETFRSRTEIIFSSGLGIPNYRFEMYPCKWRK